MSFKNEISKVFIFFRGFGYVVNCPKENIRGFGYVGRSKIQNKNHLHFQDSKFKKVSILSVGSITAVMKKKVVVVTCDMH